MPSPGTTPHDTKGTEMTPPNDSRAFQATLGFLTAWDPIGLRPGQDTPKDEYSPEAKAIAGRIADIRSFRDAERILRDTMTQHFCEGAEGIRCEQAGRDLYRSLVYDGLLRPVLAVAK